MLDEMVQFVADLDAIEKLLAGGVWALGIVSAIITVGSQSGVRIEGRRLALLAVILFALPTWVVWAGWAPQASNDCGTFRLPRHYKLDVPLSLTADPTLRTGYRSSNSDREIWIETWTHDKGLEAFADKRAEFLVGDTNAKGELAIVNDKNSEGEDIDSRDVQSITYTRIGDDNPSTSDRKHWVLKMFNTGRFVTVVNGRADDGRWRDVDSAVSSYENAEVPGPTCVPPSTADWYTGEN